MDTTFCTNSMKYLLMIASVVYLLIFSGISVWKYDALRYNARDLAIYNQVLFQLQNSSYKKQDTKFVDKFYSSIQGHNYLGDHFEPVLILIAPIYALFPDPRTLLILQTLALALAAWPLYLITKELLKRHPALDAGSKNKHNLKTDTIFSFNFLDSRRSLPRNDIRGGNDKVDWLPTFIGLLWLLHPAVQNANLFEFHSLAFAPLFLFSLFYFYLKITMYGRRAIRPYLFFFIFLLLSLTVREDVALIMCMLGLIMCWKGCKQRALILTSVPTLVVSAGWFVVAQWIISYFSPSHGYQYRIYYLWFTQFDSFVSAFKGVAAHLLTVQNLEMLLGLLLPLLFLPLLKPKWLLLSLPPLAAIILSATGGSSLIWQTHYALLLLPAVFLACIHALIPILQRSDAPLAQTVMKKSFVYSTIVVYANEFLKDKMILSIGIITAALGAALAFGPIIPALQTITTRDTYAAHARPLITSMPSQSSVAATDRFLAPLSSRRDLLLLPYVLLGVQQYGAALYAPATPDYMLLDEEDVWADLVQARTLAWTRPHAPNMLFQFRKILTEGNYRIRAQQGNMVWLMRDSVDIKIPPFTFEKRAIVGVTGGLELDRLGSVRLVVD